MKYGIIQDGKLITTEDKRQYGGEQLKTITAEVTIKETVYGEKLKKDVIVDKVVSQVTEAKPILYAAIPKFNQETQAVYQSDPVDKGDKIEIGVVVRDVPPDENPFDEVVKK